MSDIGDQIAGVAVEAAGGLLGELAKEIGALIARGFSPAEATEITRRNIRSRRARYEQEKAEDLEALDDKWDGEPEAFGD